MDMIRHYSVEAFRDELQNLFVKEIRRDYVTKSKVGQGKPSAVWEITNLVLTAKSGNGNLYRCEMTVDITPSPILEQDKEKIKETIDKTEKWLKETFTDFKILSGVIEA